MEYVDNGIPQAVLDDSGPDFSMRLRRRARMRKEYLVELKGGRCEKCGYKRTLRALDFHHREKGSKAINIGTACATYDDAFFKMVITKEVLDDCDLLCANCHRELHGERGKKSEDKWRNKPSVF